MPARAELVENLYQTELLVSDRLSHPDNAALRLGLKQVLTKVSGTVTASVVVDEAVSEPEQYLREFHFESTYQVRTDSDGNDYLAQRLFLMFEKEAVVQLLRSNNISPVGKFRPRILVWLLGRDSEKLTSLKKGIQEYAYQVQFPVQLLQANQLGISGKEQGGKPLFDRLRARSASYGKALVVVVVFLDPVTGLNWTTIDLSKSNKIKWQSFEGTVLEQIPIAFAGWVDSSGIKIDDSSVIKLNTYEITVTRVKNVADYAAIMEYIRSLPSIKIMKVTSMNNQILTLHLQSQLSSSDLSRLLSLDRRMLHMKSLQVTDLLRWSWFGKRGR